MTSFFEPDFSGLRIRLVTLTDLKTTFPERNTTSGACSPRSVLSWYPVGVRTHKHQGSQNGREEIKTVKGTQQRAPMWCSRTLSHPPRLHFIMLNGCVFFTWPTSKGAAYSPNLLRGAPASVVLGLRVGPHRGNWPNQRRSRRPRRRFRALRWDPSTRVVIQFARYGTRTLTRTCRGPFTAF